MVTQINQPVFVTDEQLKQMEFFQENDPVIRVWSQDDATMSVHADSVNEFGEPISIEIFTDGDFEVERYDGDGWEVLE